MKPVHLFGLAKFLQQEEHADRFLSGQMLARRLSVFQKFDDALSGRTDQYEALTEWRQPHSIELTISGPGHPPIVVTSKDLAGPVAISWNRHARLHCLSLYAVHTGGLGELSEKPLLSKEETAEAQRRLAVDPRCAEFGPWAVVIRPKPFQDALVAAVRARGWGMKAKTVSYYDEATFSGSFNEDQAPFMKQSHFAYQREYRACIDTSPDEPDELSFGIGNIRDFAWKLPTETLIRSLKIDFGPAQTLGCREET